METYLVNGVEIEYDTFDIDRLEAYEQGTKQVAEACERDQENESVHDKLRRVCQAITGFFDSVCGDGTAREIFGESTNVKAIYTGYRSFTEAVNRAMQDCADEMGAASQARRAVIRKK